MYHLDAVYRSQLVALDRLPVGSRIAVAYPQSAVRIVETPQ